MLITMMTPLTAEAASKTKAKTLTITAKNVKNGAVKVPKGNYSTIVIAKGAAGANVNLKNVTVAKVQVKGSKKTDMTTISLKGSTSIGTLLADASTNIKAASAKSSVDTISVKSASTVKVNAPASNVNVTSAAKGAKVYINKHVNKVDCTAENAKVNVNAGAKGTVVNGVDIPADGKAQISVEKNGNKTVTGYVIVNNTTKETTKGTKTVTVTETGAETVTTTETVTDATGKVVKQVETVTDEAGQTTTTTTDKDGNTSTEVTDKDGNESNDNESNDNESNDDSNEPCVESNYESMEALIAAINASEFIGGDGIPVLFIKGQSGITVGGKVLFGTSEDASIQYSLSDDISEDTVFASIYTDEGDIVINCMEEGCRIISSPTDEGRGYRISFKANDNDKATKIYVFPYGSDGSDLYYEKPCVESNYDSMEALVAAINASEFIAGDNTPLLYIKGTSGITVGGKVLFGTSEDALIQYSLSDDMSEDTLFASIFIDEGDIVINCIEEGSSILSTPTDNSYYTFKDSDSAEVTKIFVSPYEDDESDGGSNEPCVESNYDSMEALVAAINASEFTGGSGTPVLFIKGTSGITVGGKVLFGTSKDALIQYSLSDDMSEDTVFASIFINGDIMVINCIEKGSTILSTPTDNGYYTFKANDGDEVTKIFVSPYEDE
jgi:hypothetical protein